MRAISERPIRCLIAIGAAALLAVVAACSDPVERAENPEPVPAVSAASTSASSSVCPPGGNEVDPVRDVVEWMPGEDGRQIVQLWRFRTVKTYSADECGDAPAGSLLRAQTSRRLVWERTWPDDFREEAARRGWPAEMLDRCGIGLAQTRADAYVREACLELEEELFYGSEDARPSRLRGLPAGAFLVRAVDLGFEIDEIMRCRNQLYDYSDPAAPSNACLSMREAAERAGEGPVAATDIYPIACPPDGSAERLARDFSVWSPGGEGRWTVQLWRQAVLPVDDAACGPGNTIAVEFDATDERMVWEKTWPDDFRADAVELGWPGGMLDRCGPKVLETSSDRVLHRMCLTLRTELFYETPAAIALAAEEARSNPGLHVFRPSSSEWGWAAEQLAACKEALFEALPRGITPRQCRADAAAASVQR